MRPLIFAAGCLALIVGLIWVGQGTGHFPYPAQSFMIGQNSWAYRGGVLAAIGAILMLATARRK